MKNIIILFLSMSFLINGQVLSAQSSNEPFEDALKSFYMEDLKAAVIHLKNALKNNPKHLPSRILMAEILIAQGDGAGAEIELEFAQQGNADDKKVLLLMLEAYLLQNKYDQVINKALPILGSNKVSSDILVLKARALYNKNNTTLALVEYKNSLQLNPNNAEAILGLALVANKKGQFDKALIHIEKTLNISPLNTNALQMKASIYHLKGEVDKAIIAISEAIAINIKHFPALLTRAGIYIEQQKFAEALVDVEVILKDIPNEPRANYLKAVISQALGLSEEFSKTASHLDVVLTGMPDDVMKENPIYYYLAGLVNFNQREYLKAQDDLRDYIGIVNDDIRALKLISQVEFALGEAYSAKNYLIKARLLKPNDIEIWSLLGRAYFFTGEVEKAELYFSDVIKAEPTSAIALFELGELQLNMGQTKKAINSLSRAIELSPNNSRIKFKLANAYQQNQQPDKALALIEELIEKDKDSSYLYQQHGTLLGITNQHIKARKSFEKSYQLDELNVETLVHIARMDMVEGNVFSARNKLKTMLEKLPSQPMILVELGDTYSQKDEIEQAKIHYEKAYSLNRESSLSVGKVLDIYLAKNNLEKAIEIAEEFISRNNKNAQLHLRLADMHLKNKQFNKANNSYQLAVKYANDKSKMLYAYASGQLNMRNQQGAIISLQKAIAWNENYISAYVKLIDLFAESKNESEALTWVENLSTKINFPALILSLKGDIAFELAKFPQAENYYRESLKTDKSQKTTLGLAHSLTNQGKLDESIVLLLDWYSNQPNNAVIAIALADTYVKNESLELAAELYEKQIKINGEIPVLLNNASIVYISLGQIDKALQYAKLAYKKLPDNVAIKDTMAWAFTKANQPSRALAIFRDALAIESDNAEIKYHLAVNLIMLDRKNEAIRYLKEAIDSLQHFNEIADAEKLLKKLLS